MSSTLKWQLWAYKLINAGGNEQDMLQTHGVQQVIMLVIAPFDYSFCYLKFLKNYLALMVRGQALCIEAKLSVFRIMLDMMLYIDC